MYACCNDHSERLDPFQCEGTMTLDTENSQQEFVCDTCHARCGYLVHPDHALCPRCKFENARCACPKGAREPMLNTEERQELAKSVARAIKARKEATE